MAIPLLLLFVMLGALKVTAWVASLISLAVSIVIAIVVYGMPVGQTLLAGLTAQRKSLVGADVLRPVVDLAIHPRDEERRRRMNLRQVVSTFLGGFQPGQVGVHHGAVVPP